METWWNTPAPEASEQNAFLVVETKLHDPSGWKRRVLERVSTLVSNATRELMELVRSGLVVTMDESDPAKIHTADFSFAVNAERAERVRNLLKQEKRDKDGNLLPFSNAYRFIECTEEASGMFRVVARIGAGFWNERETKKGTVRTHAFSLIPATTGMQQLLMGYAAPDSLRHIPRALQGGVCQEVAQQVTSYLGQINSSKVKGEVNFPTVEDRDPERRRAAYEHALEALKQDVRPMIYARLRDKFPGEYAEDDARGDRMIVDDERWFAVTQSPDPHPIPLFFVTGNHVTPLEGRASFDAGISKKNRHRGRQEPSERVRADRPDAVQKKGKTFLQQWYAALPLLDSDDLVIRSILEKRTLNGSQGRGLDLNLRPFPVAGKDRWKQRDSDMLVLLSANRDRMERILRRKDLEIAWTRLVRKREEWFLQFTLRIPVQTPEEHRPMLGISLGVDAVASWCLLTPEGQEIEVGYLAPNEQITAFLSSKRSLEWDQAKGRWIGEKSFATSLESIAHAVANRLVELALERGARLAIEDISYVQKAGSDHEQNVLFTAWNYGQLRRMLGYKSQLAGLPETLFTSDYITGFTCPECHAIRSAKEKPDKAKTWRSNGTLHCRACGFEGELTPRMKAKRVALHAQSILAEREKRKAKRSA